LEYSQQQPSPEELSIIRDSSQYGCGSTILKLKEMKVEG